MIQISRNIFTHVNQLKQSKIKSFQNILNLVQININSFSTQNNNNNKSNSSSKISSEFLQIKNSTQSYLNDKQKRSLSYSNENYINNNNNNKNNNKQQSQQYNLQQQNNNNNNNNQNQRRPQNQYFNLTNELYQYKQGDKEGLVNWLTNEKTYSDRLNEFKLNDLMKESTNEINRLNQEIDNSVQAINMYIRLLVIFKSINTASFTHTKLLNLTNNIMNSSSDEEILLNLTVDVLKIFRSKKLNHHPNCVPMFSLLRLSLHTTLKYSFYNIIEDCQVLTKKQYWIEEMIQFVYDFHTSKLVKKINYEKLHTFYDRLLTLCYQFHIEPTLKFAITNISMIGDIKQINKVMYQKIKIHNSIYVRWCQRQISNNIDKLEDYLLVFVVYKLSIFDHASFGINMEQFWSSVENRFYKGLDKFSLIQRKSLLYSLGKCVPVSQNTSLLFLQLLNQNNLQKQRKEQMFLDYFGKILLSGIGRSILNKSDIIQLLPFISSIMDDFNIPKSDKIKFFVDTSAQIYRLGVYDALYWNHFMKLQNDIISDKSSFFSLYLISKTISVFADEIYNKQLITQFQNLFQKLQNLPNFNAQVAQLQTNTTSTKQSLYEMRFDFYLNAFGKQFEKEKIINELFSADFYLVNEKIAVEIEGNTHYTKQMDGTWKQNLISLFKRTYLEKLGIPTLQQTPTQHISILRDFLSQYNHIHQQRNQLESEEKQQQQ